MCVCGCVCVCVCFCVCVFLHDNLKRNCSRNLKFKNVVVYENNSDKFDIEHGRTKVKVRAQLWNISKVEDVYIFKHKVYISALEQDRVLILGNMFF